MATKTVTIHVTSPATPSQTSTRTKKISVFTGQRVTKNLTINVTPPLASKVKTKVISVTSSAPKVIVGANRTVEAGTKITLAPLTETAGSAPITGRQWKSGSTVLGTTASVDVRVPFGAAGTMANYDYVVTDQNNMSTTVTVGITVLPAPVRGPGGKAIVEQAP